MIIRHYKSFEIKVEHENNYIYDEDTQASHTLHYWGPEGKEYPAAHHSVCVWEAGQIFSSCIVTGSGGATGVYEHSFLQDGDRLLLCCADSVFCLALPSLELIWQLQADQVCCFQIRQHKDAYIVYGELAVSMLDHDGRIKWTFGGNDIFVSMTGAAFEMDEQGISLTDFSGGHYRLGFDGTLLSYTKAATEHQ